MGIWQKFKNIQSTRRKVLVIIGISIIFFIINLLFVVSFIAYPRKPSKNMNFLNKQHQKVLLSIAKTYFPDDNPLKIPVDATNLFKGIDEWLKGLNRTTFRMIMTLFVLIECLPFITLGKFVYFSNANEDIRIDALKNLEEHSIHDIRALSAGIRSMINMHYFNQPGVLSALNIKQGCG